MSVKSPSAMFRTGSSRPPWSPTSRGRKTSGRAPASAWLRTANPARRKARVDPLESIQVYPTTYDGELLHAPVWFMEYAHKGKQMFILVDGSSGGVMDGERPGFSLW